LEEAAADFALGRRWGIEMPHIHAKRIKKFLLIIMSHMLEQPFPRGRLGPEVAWCAVRWLMSERGENPFA
jgi:hypothetical protein